MSNIISASLLSANMLELGKELDIIERSGADMIHFDVMDGSFVKNISFGFPVLEAVKSRSELTLDVHLMIDCPDKYIERFVSCGADIITIHMESPCDTLETLKAIKKSGIRSGLALKPGTPFESAEKYMKYTDMLLVMTVEPGFGGQKFMSVMLPKIESAREFIEREGLSTEIQVDGGINDKTAPLAVKAGAKILVAGNYLFKADSMREAVNKIK